jgi:hypothetical protein
MGGFGFGKRSSGDGSYDFLNGITEDSGTVKLGGALTEDTTIDVDSHLMEFTTAYGHNLIFTDNFLGAGYNFAGIYHNDNGVVFFNGIIDYAGIEYSSLAVLDTVNNKSSFVNSNANQIGVGYVPNSATPLNANQIVFNNNGAELMSDNNDANELNLRFAYCNGDGTTTQVAKVYRDGAIATDEGFYIGNKITDGSWRFVTSGADLVIQKREAGNWVTKQTLI